MVFSSFFSTETLNERLERRQVKWDTLREEKERWVENLRNEHLRNNELPSESEKEFYSGKNILITGGTGFVGQVLAEKLLRSIPTVGNIFVIVRPKGNQTPAERIARTLSNELFDQLKRQQPNALQKVIAIPGDLSLQGLGLSLQDRQRLQNEVSIVFHSAASIRFDDQVQKAVLLNTRGTHQIVELCKSMKTLKCLLHVSTTFCNTDQELTLEKVYPTPINWRYMVKLAETTPADQLEAISHKILGFQPNTYTFSKQLGEKVVDDARFEIPVIIMRPAVVVGIVADPIPGWTDTLFGPVGFGVGICKGVLRVFYADRNVQLNSSPVDSTCAVLIAGAWLRGTNTKISDDPHCTDVVNASMAEVCKSDYGDLVGASAEMAGRVCAQLLRAPHVDMTTNVWYYYYRLFVSHVLVGAIFDLILWIAGQKPQVVKVYRKIHNVNMKLLPFVLKHHPTTTTNFWRILSYVTDSSLAPNLKIGVVDDTYSHVQYVLNKLLKDPKSSSKVHKIYEIFHYIQQTIKYSFLTWLGWKCTSYFLHRFTAY